MRELVRTHDRSYIPGMNASADRTYDRILDRGLEMLSVNGLSGVTIGALANAVGMSKSGLFAHFRSKEEIQLSLIAHANAIVASQVIAPAMAEPAGLPRLTALMRNWLGWTRRAGLGGGCPVTSALFELDDLEGEVRALVSNAEAQSQELLFSLVNEAIASGTLRADADARQIVWEVRGIYLGHHVSSRFVGEPFADECAWTAFEALLERYRS